MQSGNQDRGGAGGYHRPSHHQKQRLHLRRIGWSDQWKDDASGENEGGSDSGDVRKSEREREVGRR
ncbi:hypothetical protein A2U01_0026360 [Trifolium medium]|uniref:Uncharacterized protein n=1 Tax=Trifolium medium TaxID=97028 RepID=A0A392P1L0_9FABA|nr:hypothetical protein [Trifolium medium]